MSPAVAHTQDTHHHSSEKPLIQCYKCGELCKGEVLRVQNKHFHLKCFTCKACGCDLAQGGFFMKNGEYLCMVDYQRMHGTRCNGCGDFVEGEVVTALGKTYHPACFTTVPGRRQGDLQREGLPVSILHRAHVSGTQGHPGLQQ
uniref:Actin-binding LIM protein 1-like n=1 Tax=Fundulus heteroclitus TaxID=8078 RepID=A0A3Q2THW3_FUNHE